MLAHRNDSRVGLTGFASCPVGNIHFCHGVRWYHLVARKFILVCFRACNVAAAFLIAATRVCTERAPSLRAYNPVHTLFAGGPRDPGAVSEVQAGTVMPTEAELKLQAKYEAVRKAKVPNTP